MGWLDQRVELRALLAGVAADWLGTYLTLPLLLLAYGVTTETVASRSEELAASAGFLLALTAHGTFFTGFGGYVAARLAPGDELRHAVIIGIVSLVLVATLRFSPGGSGEAVAWWAEMLAYLLPVPAAAAGGWLALYLARAGSGRER